MIGRRRTSLDPRPLVRLLADLPQERRVALGAVWGLADPGDRGWVATLYHRMMDAATRDDVVRRLPEAVQLVFATLAAGRTALSASALSRSLPFSDDDLEQAVAALEASGLAWLVHRVDRGDTGSARHWFVPPELGGSPSPKRPAPRLSPPAGVGRDARPTAPTLQSTEVTLERVRRPGAVARTIGDSEPPRRQRATDAVGFDVGVPAYAEHCGTALGVWTRAGRGLEAGPRAAAWQRLDLAGRVRALARLWLVDEQSPRPVSGRVRRALWDALRNAAVDTWYDLDSLARRAAWFAAPAGSQAAEAGQSAGPTGLERSIARRDVELGVEVLAWIGVIAIADDARGRPVAVRLTAEGLGALT
ncbi:MAG TPA: hypothetical protein VNL16_09045 [Chloroflexota bacterium]|nr:hypothetical protein [Chloroflexota bacterium]